jgi:2-polyprenyl-3-methyl-5-hydroxy-6-metoxy-1,4-benzoquinol methylase
MKRERYNRYERIVDFLLSLDLPFFRKYIFNKVYDESFYQETHALKTESFRNVASTLSQHIPFATVLEIGCGTGQLLVELHRNGKNVLGCEISEAGIRGAPEEITVFQADAAKPIHLNRRFDLVLCIEVAEHIRQKHSAQLVANCTHLGRQVFFTAAPKGQTGVGHINLQPYSFWIELFAEHGFVHQEALSRKIQGQMRSENVLSWITNNLMVFSPRSHTDVE